MLQPRKLEVIVNDILDAVLLSSLKLLHPGTHPVCSVWATYHCMLLKLPESS